jgi:acyl-CoA thioester hydrolase
MRCGFMEKCCDLLGARRPAPGDRLLPDRPSLRQHVRMPARRSDRRLQVAGRRNMNRSAYRHFLPLQTRWADNDIYGHVNNVAYYGYFDTIVNECLIASGALDIHRGEVIGLVVETGCKYFAPLAFPEKLEGALRVAKLGNSSVRYELAIFKEGAETPAAEGHFVHVYVDRATRRPVALPARLRATLQGFSGESG